MKSRDQSRSFGVADSLILMAGIAAGLAAVRVMNNAFSSAGLWDVFLRPTGGWWSRSGFVSLFELGSLLGAPFLTAITPACLFIQSRRPQPRRLIREPGFAAGLIALAAIGLAAFLGFACWLGSLWGPSDLFDAVFGIDFLGGMIAGPGVLSSWTTMAMCGIWRPRPTWQDRLGRLVGIGWIVLSVSLWVKFVHSWP